jgi:hypothetical protein
MLSRENLKLAVVAVFCLLIAWTGPSVAHGVHAKFAHNADKVDGKHAVSSGVSKAKAKKKLVAHDKKGELPAKFIPKSFVTEAEYDARPGTKLLAAGFSRGNGTLDSAFYRSGTWDAVRTGTGTYRLRFRAPAMCAADLWPAIHLTGWHTNAEVLMDGGNKNCATDTYTYNVAVRNSAGALTDGDWGFSLYGTGTTIGPVSAARPSARGFSSR